MEAVQRVVDILTDGSRSIVAWLDSLVEMAFADPGNVALFMLMGAFAGFIALVAYAQVTGPGSSIPVPSTINAALGNKSSVVRRPGDPPIPPPTEVVALRIYPIKSCRGFEVDSTRLRKTGLTLDRNWMFVDAETYKFLTIRSDPSMTLIDTKIVEKDGEQLLEISIHGTTDRVTIPAFPTPAWFKENATLRKVNIWDKDTDGWEYSDEINSKFSHYFKKKVALVYKGPTHRNVAVNGSVDKYGMEQNHNFADVMSLQVASEASIKDLNRRLREKGSSLTDLTIERFRPNIIVRGRDDHPWEEDTWKRVRITTRLPNEEALYKLDLDIVARCARCRVPNVDPNTAEEDAKEPWDELMAFRRVDNGGAARWKPCFGMLAIPKNEGVIQLGATLDVLETTDKHLYNVRPFSEL